MLTGRRPLSHRERQVLALSCQARTADEIGRILGITRATVRNRRAAAYRKLGVTDLAAACRMRRQAEA